MEKNDCISVEEVINSLLLLVPPERINDTRLLSLLFYNYFGLCTYHRVFGHHELPNDHKHNRINSDQLKDISGLYEPWTGGLIFDWYNIETEISVKPTYKPDLEYCIKNFDFYINQDWSEYSPLDVKFLISIVRQWSTGSSFDSLFIEEYHPHSGWPLSKLKSHFYDQILEHFTKGLDQYLRMEGRLNTEMDVKRIAAAIKEVERRLYTVDPENKKYYLTIKAWLANLIGVVNAVNDTNSFKLNTNIHNIKVLYLDLIDKKMIDGKKTSQSDFVQIFYTDRWQELLTTVPQPGVYWNKPITSFRYFIYRLIKSGLADDRIAKSILETKFFWHFFKGEWRPIKNRKNLPLKMVNSMVEEETFLLKYETPHIKTLNDIILKLK